MKITLNPNKYCVDYRLVKLILGYLDKGFRRASIEQIDKNGYPTQIPIVSMIGMDGNPLRNLTDKQLFYLLQDRFQQMFSDSNKLDRVLRAVIKDWYYKKAKNGLLSKNLLETTVKDTKERLSAARKDVDTSPTEKQIKAGNYAKGHVTINGYRITIENPKDSYRKGKDPNGKEWKVKMKNDYGYFLQTKGKDGDAIDVFIGPKLDSKQIFVVDQKINGVFDESKVMMGFDNETDAKNAYMNNYSEGWKGFWKITSVDDRIFRKWLYDGHRQRLPFFKYVEIKKNKNSTH